MQCSAQFVPQPLSMLERWLLGMERALAQRELLHVQTMTDGSVIAITKYRGMSVFLAGREIVAQIEHILSHVRAARREPMVNRRASIAAAAEDLRERVAEAREIIGVLRAEQIHGRTRLTDCLALAGAASAQTVPASTVPALDLIEALLDRMKAIEAFPEQLDALLEGAAHG